VPRHNVLFTNLFKSSPNTKNPKTAFVFKKITYQNNISYNISKGGFSYLAV